MWIFVWWKLPGGENNYSRGFSVTIRSMTTAVFTRTRLTWQAYLLIGYFAYLINTFGPLTPFLRAEMDLSYTVASLHFSAYAVGVILTGLGLHRLAQRFGLQRLVWVGAFGMAAGAVLLAAGRTPAVTIAGTFLMGLLGTFLVALMNSVLVVAHREHSAIALSESAVASTLISALAPLAIGFFAGTILTWRAGLLLMVLLLPLLYLLYGRTAIPVTAEASPAPAAGSANPAGLPLLYWLYWLLTLLAVAIEFCTLFWAADFLEKETGLARADAAAAVSAFLVAMLVGRAASSRLLHRIPAGRVLLFSLLLNGAGFLVFWLSHTPLPALAGLMLAGIGLAGVFPIVNALALATVPGRLVEGSARLSLAIGIAILLLPLLLGRLADLAGIRAAYALVIGVILLALLLTRLAAAQAKRPTG